LRLARLFGGGLLIAATLVAAGMWVAGVGPRALMLVGALWAIYGLYSAFLDGLVEPLIDGTASLLENIGLTRAGGGYSSIETLAAQGNLEAAATAYLERARAGRGDPEALVRRALLLSGPLQSPRQAALELESFREARRLNAESDLRVGAALARLSEGPLSEPGRAMVELRRLITQYPGARNARRLRRELDVLRDQRFGAPAQ
ncbi:MAG: hypothetical protein ACHQ2E_02815, partial [Gemmatimonadales bacterium]